MDHHRALDDSRMTLAILRKVYDSRAIAPYIDRCDGEFYRRVTFKTTYICDIHSPLVEKSHLRFPCPKCGEESRRLTRWNLKNKSFRADFRCTRCGHRRHETDFTVTAADLDRGILTLDNAVTVKLSFRSIYNVYNILAAYSVCRTIGIAADTAAGVISNYVLKNGRMQTFTLGAHHGTLLTSKHENSIAYDTNLRYIRSTDKPCTVLVIVDAVSRKYFTSETSWLWDIDFDLLNCPHVGKIILSGRYCNDLAMRFSFTSIPQERLEVIPEIPAAAQALQESGDEALYVVTCFSDRDKLLDLPAVKKEA